MTIEMSSSDFQFATDEESLAYLQKIVESMVQLFDVKPENCVSSVLIKHGHTCQWLVTN
jgi:hypothetical protein